MTADKLKNAKKSLDTNFESSPKDIPPIAPPKVAQNTIINLESLKPPPPPPKVSHLEVDSRLNKRSQVISELKEMFMKRGLVAK